MVEKRELEIGPRRGGTRSVSPREEWSVGGDVGVGDWNNTPVDESEHTPLLDSGRARPEKQEITDKED